MKVNYRHKIRVAEPFHCLGCFAELLEHLVVLDTFSDDLETQVVTEIDRLAHDHLVLFVDQHVGDEAAVDLQLGHGKTAQITE